MADFLCTNITDRASPAIAAAVRSGVDFRLEAPPKTDIYTSPVTPGQLFDYTAPVVCRRMAREDFRSLQVTAAAAWQTQFDQAGLVFTLPTASNPSPDAANAAEARTHPAWVKAGIECNDGDVCVSVVARSPGGWCDWSLVPLSLLGVTLGPVVSATLQFTRAKNALMVWLLPAHEAGKPARRLLIRKVPWVFLDDEAGALGHDVLVGVYAARPDPYDATAGRSLDVAFSGLQVETEPAASPS